MTDRGRKSEDEEKILGGHHRMVKEKIVDIFVDLLGVSAEEVTENARLIEDLAVDSLDAVELSLALEEQFSLTVEDHEIEQLQTVSDVINLIQGKLG
ncbi:MAG TPA: acyl carrier protein [Clostridiaceae bacterium]|nr:acyl carrier protein [Clostridiaceae bacterium]